MSVSISSLAKTLCSLTDGDFRRPPQVSAFGESDRVQTMGKLMIFDAFTNRRDDLCAREFVLQLLLAKIIGEHFSDRF
jgi:hypothetical protein